MKQNKRGRDKFRRYKIIFYILSKFYSIFPRRVRHFFYNFHVNQMGNIGLAIRYVNICTLAKRIGDNVTIQLNRHKLVKSPNPLGNFNLRCLDWKTKKPKKIRDKELFLLNERFSKTQMQKHLLFALEQNL